MITPTPENGLTVLTAERVRELREWCRPKTVDEARTKQPANCWGLLTALCDAWLAAQETDEQGIPFDKRAHQIDDGWRPIETAPRDGRIIIGWSAGWESPTAIQWVDGYEWRDELGDERREIADWDWNGTIQCPPSHDPTHWRPLPAPPGAGT